MHQLMRASFYFLDLVGEFPAEAWFKERAASLARQAHPPGVHGFTCSLLGRFSFDVRSVFRKYDYELQSFSA